MIYEFTYQKDGITFIDTVSCCPEEFEEIQKDLIRNGFKNITINQMIPEK